MTRSTTTYLICAAAWAVPGRRPPVARPPAEGSHLPRHAAADVRRSASGSKGGCSRSSSRSRWWRWRRLPTSASACRISSPKRWGGRGRVVAHYLRVRQRVPDRRRPAEHAGRARRVRRRAGAQMTTHFGLMVALRAVRLRGLCDADARRAARAASPRRAAVRRLRRRRHPGRLAAVPAAVLRRRLR